MAAGGKSKANNSGTESKCKKRKQCLPHNKLEKKEYPLRPGVQGFFVTCHGGRERQASHEAVNVTDSRNNFPRLSLQMRTSSSHTMNLLVVKMMMTATRRMEMRKILTRKMKKKASQIQVQKRTLIPKI